MKHIHIQCQCTLFMCSCLRSRADAIYTNCIPNWLPIFHFYTHHLCIHIFWFPCLRLYIGLVRYIYGYAWSVVYQCCMELYTGSTLTNYPILQEKKVRKSFFKGHQKAKRKYHGKKTESYIEKEAHTAMEQGNI